MESVEMKTRHYKRETQNETWHLEIEFHIFLIMKKFDAIVPVLYQTHLNFRPMMSQ